MWMPWCEAQVLLRKRIKKQSVRTKTLNTFFIITWELSIDYTILYYVREEGVHGSWLSLVCNALDNGMHT